MKILNAQKKQKIRLQSLFLMGLIALASGFYTAAQAADLNTIMQGLGAKFRELGTLAPNPATADAARAVNRDLFQLSLEAVQVLPTTVTNLPEPEQTEKAVIYRKLILQLLTQSQDLELALARGNAEQVAEALRALAQTRREGHTLFRPN